jgi:hypothetical protein
LKVQKRNRGFEKEPNRNLGNEKLSKSNKKLSKKSPDYNKQKREFQGLKIRLKN